MVPAVREETAVTEKEIVREKEVIVKIRCPYCHGLYDELLDECPHCGAKR
jgi:Zn finger protein HypA/HybF involved in hydrogenase expression